MYKIRTAKVSDYRAVKQLVNSNENMQLKENDSILAEDFYKESLLETEAKWFVVEKSGEVLAFIFFTKDADNKGIEIKKFTIHHTYKKKGINEHLYKKVEQIASRSEVTNMQVVISQNHLDVIDFFERKDWVREGQFHVKYMK